MQAQQDLVGAIDETAVVVAAVEPDQWSRPSPCEGWTARDVLDHLVVGHRFFARGLGGGEADSEDDSPVTAYQTSADAMVAAFQLPGAMERPVSIPAGTFPGAVALRLRIVEALVHGWDIARATGQTPRADEGVAERALQFTEEMLTQLPADRRPFGPPQPADAGGPALDRLVARLGRPL